MPLTRLTNANLEDAKRELARLTSDGIRSDNVRQLAELTDTTIPGIFDFIRSTFPYISDPYGLELFIAPNRMAEDYHNGIVRGADCEDLAMLVAAAAASVGHQTRLVLLATQNGEVDHAIAQVLSPILGWVDIDASSNLPLGWHISGTRQVVNY